MSLVSLSRVSWSLSQFSFKEDEIGNVLFYLTSLDNHWLGEKRQRDKGGRFLVDETVRINPRVRYLSLRRTKILPFVFSLKI